MQAVCFHSTKLNKYIKCLVTLLLWFMTSRKIFYKESNITKMIMKLTMYS